MKSTALTIAFFNKELPSDKPNGVSCQVHRLADALCLRGHRVTVFSFSPKPEKAGYAHVQLVYPWANRVWRKFAPAVSYRKIATGPFDIVHYHGDDYLIRGDLRRIRTFYGSALQEARHAATVRRFVYQTLFYLFELRAACAKGTLVGISKNTQKSIPRINHVIPCGVPTTIYTPQKKKTPNPSILFLGDLDSRKRGRFLIEIFEREILPAIPDCELRIAGPQQIQGPSITYLGVLKEQHLIREFQQAWVYCFPSTYEGFGVPAIEAMACGTPVISTPHAGIADIITNRHDGIITAPSELGKTLTNVLNDSALRTQLATRGRQTCINRFDTDALAALYESLYLKARNSR